jgi:hypothetical protein
LLVDDGMGFCALSSAIGAGTDPDDFVDVRRFDDMAPFHFQIEAALRRAVWGLEAAAL